MEDILPNKNVNVSSNTKHMTVIVINEIYCLF